MTVADGIAVRAGFIHDRSAPEVIETIKSMLKRITAAGKPAGILTVGNPEQAQMWLDDGADKVRGIHQCPACACRC